MPIQLDNGQDLRPGVGGTTTYTGEFEMVTTSQVAKQELVQEIEQTHGTRHLNAIKYILYCSDLRQKVSAGSKFSLDATKTGKVCVEYYPSGVTGTREYASAAEAFEEAMMRLASYIYSDHPDMLISLYADLKSIDPTSGMEPVTANAIQTFSDELSQTKDTESASSTPHLMDNHQIEIQHDIDDLEDDLDFETRMYQLAMDEENLTDDVALVTNYIPKPDTEDVVLLVKLPNQSRGRVVYDMPESRDATLVDVLDVAVADVDSDDRSVSLANIEDIAGAEIPVFFDEDSESWGIDVNRSVSTQNTTDDSEPEDFEKAWGIDAGRVIIAIAMILALILGYVGALTLI